MLFLLDANALIDANRDYYPIERVPEFWEWLEHMGNTGQVKIAAEIYDEVTRGSPQDPLVKWLKDAGHKAALLLDEEVDRDKMNHVIRKGYGINGPTEDDLETMGRDPLLISYALKTSVDRCIVTTETSKPRRQGANRKIPDVCQDLQVSVCTTFQFIQKLDFRTSWKAA